FVAVYRPDALFFFFHCYAAPRSLHSFPTRRSSDLIFESHFVFIFGEEARPGFSKTHGLPAAGLNLAHKKKKHHENKNDGQPTNKDRKSTRLNSSHVKISYAVFCLKKKKKTKKNTQQ